MAMSRFEHLPKNILLRTVFKIIYFVFQILRPNRENCDIS
jgi:hypothetical protein